MAMAYSYRCRDYPGMETCPASFVAETEQELWHHIELHGADAHKESPAAWTFEERKLIRDVIRNV